MKRQKATGKSYLLQQLLFEGLRIKMVFEERILKILSIPIDSGILSFGKATK